MLIFTLCLSLCNISVSSIWRYMKARFGWIRLLWLSLEAVGWNDPILKVLIFPLHQPEEMNGGNLLFHGLACVCHVISVVGSKNITACT